MIQSLNTVIDDEQMNFFIEELEERDEMLCILNACAGAATPCLGQACVGACFGISLCLVGLHIMD